MSRSSLIFVAIAAGLLAGGCGSSAMSSSPSTTTRPAADSPPAAADVITIRNFAFGTPITVKPGATVTVRNADTMTHTLSADNGAFDAGNIFAGAAHTFVAPQKPGTYKFHCNIHGNMHGTIIVAR